MFWDGTQWRHGVPDDAGAPRSYGWTALVSLFLGLVGLGAWWVAPLGVVVGLTGLFLGSRALQSRMKDLAIGGMCLSLLGLVAATINGGVALYAILGPR